MKEQLKQAGAFNNNGSSGAQAAAAGLAILIALMFPEHVQVFIAGGATPVLTYLLPKQLPWKKGENNAE